jgi:hypothetical protein
MKREAPTEREIAELIASAFEGLPAPDARRLAAIEQQLLAQTRSRGRTKIAWWWLVGALVAGGATAMWWAVDYSSVGGQKESLPAIKSPAVTAPLAEQPTRVDGADSTESTPAGNPVQKQGPVIYQRER